MRDRNDVQRLGLYSVINRERKPIEKNPASAGLRGWIAVWGLPNPLDGN
jgi:hypothetical protein